MAGFRLVQHATADGPIRVGTSREGAPGEPLLETRYRLPTFARNHSVHSDGSNADPRLQRALRQLEGKFSVVNPAIVTPLPPRTKARAQSILTNLRHDGHASGPLTVELLEQLDPLVMHECRSRPGGAMPGRDILFHAELRYLLLLGGTASRGPRSTPDPVPARTDEDMKTGMKAGTEAGIDAAPERWFHSMLLVPDAEAIRQMAPPTAHFYRYITGRLGGGSDDRYWYLDAWERFGEDGRVIGCLSPALVEHGRPAGQTTNTVPDPAAPTYEDFLFGDVDIVARDRLHPYTPNFDRRGFVPPGYCLVHYFATIELAFAPTKASAAA